MPHWSTMNMIVWLSYVLLIQQQMEEDKAIGSRDFPQHIGDYPIEHMFTNPICEKTFVSLPRIYGLKGHYPRNRYKTERQPLSKSHSKSTPSKLIERRSIKDILNTDSNTRGVKSRIRTYDSHDAHSFRKNKEYSLSQYKPMPSQNILQKLNERSPINDRETSHKVSFAGLILPPISKGSQEQVSWESKHAFYDEKPQFSKPSISPIHEVVDEENMVTPEISKVVSQKGLKCKTEGVMEENNSESLENVVVKTEFLGKHSKPRTNDSLDTYFRDFIKRETNESFKDTHSQRNATSITSISVPNKHQIGTFIDNYKPFDKTFNLKDIMKSDKFQIVSFKNGGLYIGEMANKLKDGLGVFVTDKHVFEGVFAGGFKQSGNECNAEGVYTGQMVNGRREGKGMFKWANGETYDGDWKEGMKHGNGVWKSPKGDTYNGEWHSNKQEGFGTHQHQHSTYMGYFKNFLKDGEGTEMFASGDIYKGEYSKGKPNGYGVYTWKNGNEYRGSFVEGLREGEGVLVEGGDCYRAVQVTSNKISRTVQVVSSTATGHPSGPSSARTSCWNTLMIDQVLWSNPLMRSQYSTLGMFFPEQPLCGLRARK